MSNVLVEESNLKGVADAIRAKNGLSETYKPSEMAAAIGAIQTGASTAAEVSYDNTESGLDADNAQDAIDELSASLSNKADLVNGKVPEEQLPDNIGGLLPQINVTTAVGASVTATLGEKTVGPVVADENGLATLELTDYGEWTLTAALDGKTVSDTLEVPAVELYAITLGFGPLPYGYTQLEYIQNIGTFHDNDDAFIDTGIVVDTDNMSIETTLNIQAYRGDSGNNSRDYASYFGAQYMANKKWYETLFMNANAFSKCVISNGNDETIDVLSYCPLDTDLVITASAVNGKCNVNINGSSISGTYTANIPNTNFYLFTGSPDKNFSVMGKCKIGRTRIYKNGTLVRDYYPSKHGNVLGMYDTISNTFFENAGTGSFVAGPEV